MGDAVGYFVGLRVGRCVGYFVGLRVGRFVGSLCVLEEKAKQATEGKLVFCFSNLWTTTSMREHKTSRHNI